MRVLIQRVSRAAVHIGDSVSGEISKGLLILLGIEEPDGREDADWLAMKIAKLRIFSDEADLMNLALNDVQGGLLVVSQFTLHASTKKGNRPSYIRAARPEQAIPLYEYFIETLGREAGQPVQTGQFGADMQVHLINDGPVTLWMDSRDRE